jgi:hypothetical protein
MKEMGLTTRGMNEQLSDFYKQMAPMIIESVNTRVQPLLLKIQQDPTSTAILLAVVTGILGRLTSGDLGDMGGIGLLDYP